MSSEDLEAVIRDYGNGTRKDRVEVHIEATDRNEETFEQLREAVKEVLDQ